MINQYPTRIALILVAGIATIITTNAASYASIQERQQALIAQHQALIQKWQPALDNPSDATLKIVIKQKAAALKELYENAFNDYDAKTFKSMRDSLKALPAQFMCNELDKDIETIFKLQETARVLNMDYTLDPLPFQQLRAAIDTLPCMVEEQEACTRLASMYKYFLAFFGGVLIANHFSLIPLNTPRNV